MRKKFDVEQACLMMNRTTNAELLEVRNTGSQYFENVADSFRAFFNKGNKNQSVSYMDTYQNASPPKQ